MLTHHMILSFCYPYKPQLRELVIIDPQWLAEVMASIVSFKARWSLGSLPFEKFRAF